MVQQVGGTHYGTTNQRQHWDIVDDHMIPYLEGCATKYLCRWRKKGGLEDVKKSLSYIDKIIISPRATRKRYVRAPRVSSHDLTYLFSLYEVTFPETSAIELIFNWKDISDLRQARDTVARIIEREESGT